MTVCPFFGLFPRACRAPGMLVGMLVILLAAAPAVARQATTKPPGKRPAARTPLPLDPLTPAEVKRAEGLALADARVKELLGSTPHRLISITLLPLKPALKEEGHETLEQSKQIIRSAEVVLFRPEGEVGVRAVVELAHGTVMDVSRLDSDRVPLTADDLAAAFQLALRNEEVRAALGPAAPSYRIERLGETLGPAPDLNVVRGLRVRGKSAEDPCAKHRCMQLFFRRGQQFLQKPIVIVDLSASQVYVERREP